MSFNPRLSVLCASMLTAAALVSSTASLAANYKGDYKNEAIPAAPCVQPLMLKDGFYVGAQVGYDSYNVGVSRTATIAGSTFAGSNNFSSNGWVGGLLAGYGMYFNNMYYLAGEVFGNGSGASTSGNYTSTVAGTTANLNTSASVNGSWGVSVLPGVKLNDSTLTYVRLGYNQAKFTGKVTGNVGGTAYSPNRKNSWQGGFNYGVGMESAIYQNVSLRGEFTHTNYNSVKVNTPVSSTKFSPSDNQYMVALIYHFA